MATNVNVLDRAPDIVWVVSNKVAPYFEVTSGLDRPLCRSYSKYDGEHVDLDVAKLYGVLLMAQRSTLGWSGVDPTFGDRYIQAGDIGMFRTSYHIHYPSLSVPRQFENWISVHPNRDIIPRVIDAELQDGQTDAKVGETIWDMMVLCYEYDGVWPLVYSRYLLLDKWLKHWSDEQLSYLQLWGARYLWDRTREHPGPPYGNMPNLGNRIKPEQWLFHQTADKKAPFPGETDRETIVCWERWQQGNVSDMFRYISENWNKETPEPEPDLEDRVYDLEGRVAKIEDWISIHDGIEPDIETITVKATDNFSEHVVVGYNTAGKPKMAPPPEDDPSRLYVKAGYRMKVLAKAWLTEGDDPNSPVIISDGGDKYYVDAVYGQYIRKDKVMKVD